MAFLNLTSVISLFYMDNLNVSTFCLSLTTSREAMWNFSVPEYNDNTDHYIPFHLVTLNVIAVIGDYQNQW